MLNVIFFSLVGGLLSLSGALILFRNNKQAKKVAKYATPFAAGVLLAAAFTDLLPEAIELKDVRPVLIAALGGIILFFLLERYVRVFHHHHDEDVAGNRSQNSLIIIGDTLHNILDGVAIGAAFLIDVPTGVVAALAVAAHEIPQEIGDFGLLIKNGMSRKRVVIVNALSALATTVAAVIVYAVGDSESTFVPYLLALTAGFFIYIAASDIIPEIHGKSDKRDIRPWLLVFGAAFIMVVSPLAHDYIDAGHSHDESHESLHEHDEHDDADEHEDYHDEHDDHEEEHDDEKQ